MKVGVFFYYEESSCCARCRNRTYDPVYVKDVLYQLS